MSTTTVTVNANVSPAQANLRKLEKQVEGLNKTFSGLGKLVAGLALGNFTLNVLKSANAVFELSKATGVGIAEIQGLSAAFVTNGSDAESAQKAIVKFNQSLNEAQLGSSKTQYEFSQLGITLDDLRTLSEGEILRKTVDGLAKLPAGAQRSALAISLLGKGVNTVDFKGLNQDLDQFIQKGREAEPTITNIGDLFSNVQKIGKQFSDELLKSGGSIVELLVKLTNNTEQIAKSLAHLVKIVAFAAATWAIFAKIIPAVSTAMNVLQAILTRKGTILVAVATNAKNVGLAFARLFTATGKITKAAGATITAWTRVKQVFFTLAGMLANVLRILLRFAGIAGIIITVAQAIDFFATKVLGLGSPLEWLGEKLSWIGEKFKQFLKYLGFEFDQQPVQELNQNLTETEQRTNNVIAGNKTLENSIFEVTQKYKKYNDELVRNIGLELQYLKMSDDAVEIAKAQQQIYDQAISSIEELQKKKADLKTEDMALSAEIDRQIKIIEQSITKDQIRAENAIKNIQKYRLEQEKLNKQLELAKISFADAQTLSNLNEQLALIGQYGDELENNMLVLQVTQELQNKLTDIAMRQMELENQRLQLGEARFQQELEHLNALRQAAYDYAGARLDAEKQILAAQRATREDARLGVEQAMADVAKQFEPYQQAQDAVKQGWNRISGAIDDFIETGKFNFKDFARSIIADLAKMIAKALVFKAIQGALGMFGLSLPGLANGGPAKQNQPYIVGEKGPELFVPRTSGTVVPNNKLAGMEGKGQVNAPITNNYITNNINAVDAKSVAQLFAENRKTLLGTVRMAERELPYAMG